MVLGTIDGDYDSEPYMFSNHKKSTDTYDLYKSVKVKSKVQTYINPTLPLHGVQSKPVFLSRAPK